jgi:hypothetical protein
MQAVQDLMRNQMVFGLGMAAAQGSAAAVKNLIALQLWDQCVKHAIPWATWAVQRCRRPPRGTTTVVHTTPRAMIECERTFKATANTNGRPPSSTTYSSRMDAVIHYVTTLPAMKTLLSIGQHDYLPHEFEPVSLAPDVYFQLKEMTHQEGALDFISFKLFCYEHDVQHLQAYIDTCNTDYARRVSNELGSHLYYFDQVVQSKGRRTQNPLPDSHLVYTKSKFLTTRTFRNVFFDQREVVHNRVQFFLNDRSWYEKKGIPYTLGFLFHGDPGCGKTSTVKAIANEGRRHIINVHLAEIKTKAQLHHLFFNEELHVQDGSTFKKFTIPIHERIYVIEDIDAMGDAVLRREWKKPEPAKKKDVDAEPWERIREEEAKDTIDLSFLLNLLDGTLEAHGRILVLSSNFPERIDRALIRPGRVDMIVRFQRCTREVLRELVTNFYDQPFEEHPIWQETSMDGKWTPAEANQILFRNFETPQQALDELTTLQPRDLYGFENPAPE